jgi:hypothetical protein
LTSPTLIYLSLCRTLTEVIPYDHFLATSIHHQRKQQEEKKKKKDEKDKKDYPGGSLFAGNHTKKTKKKFETHTDTFASLSLYLWKRLFHYSAQPAFDILLRLECMIRHFYDCGSICFSSRLLFFRFWRVI